MLIYCRECLYDVLVKNANTSNNESFADYVLVTMSKDVQRIGKSS